MKRLYLACMLSLRGCRSYWIPGSYAPTWSEKRTSVLKAIEKEGLQGGTGDNNWVGRHRHIHDPGIQQEPLIFLADAYGQLGHIDEGLGILEETQALMETSGERYYAAEWHQVRGELLWQDGARPQAPATRPQGGDAGTPRVEACFHQALAVARRQQAKSWELRAAMRLARLWQQQGKRAKAYALLAPVYGWFTEGFDTADLQEAKVLLEELAE